jgi:hypothetical protein
LLKRGKKDANQGCAPLGGGGPDDRSVPGDGVPTVERLAAAVPLVRVAGRLAGEAAVALRQTVYSQLARSPRLVVVDLRPVIAVPPAGVAALVDIAYEAGAGDVGLCLVYGPGDDHHPLPAALHSAGVFELFEIQPDPDAALDTLS